MLMALNGPTVAPNSILGTTSKVNPQKGVWNCKACGNTTNFSAINIPYASKLLLQELETMSISSRILTQGKLSSTLSAKTRAGLAAIKE